MFFLKMIDARCYIFSTIFFLMLHVDAGETFLSHIPEHDVILFVAMSYKLSRSKNECVEWCPFIEVMGPNWAGQGLA